MGIVGAIVALIFSVSYPLHTPESAKPWNGKLYVSNVGSLPPDKKDGDGFVALLELNGKVIKRDFISGLNAPKGLDVCDGKLFISDIDRVIVAEPNNGKIVKEIAIEGAKFLNDVACKEGQLFVSDTQTNTIYQIDAKNYEVKTFLKSRKLQGPNGLAFTKDGTLLIASWGGGKLLRYASGKIETLASGFENLDGVAVLESGDVIFSDFSAGKVYLLKGGKAKELLSNLTTPADIGYADGKLFIPEFLASQLKVVEIKKSTTPD